MSYQIKERLTQEMKSAMKAKQKERLLVIRTMLAAVKQKEVDERVEVDDDMLLIILDKQLKQRRESAKIYHEAGRDELVKTEEFEMGIIQEFLPEAMSDDEINALIEQAIESTSAQSMKDMGKVMGILKPQVQGKADMSQISQLIKNKLQG
ncbi:MAG: GatB/YqeY domain-containing protein [Pseudomonadota bacterium]